MNGKISLLVLFLFVLQFYQFADNITFRHLSTDDGLSQNSIYSFLQDSKGFIWIGTANGLNRYDGYNFTVQKFTPNNPHSINARWITALCEDKTGIIWIGSSSNGVGRFDPISRKTTKYYFNPGNKNSISSNFIKSICRSANGDIWIGTSNGLNKYDPEKNNFQRIKYSQNTDPGSGDNYVKTVLPDKEHLWIGTRNGLFKYDIETETSKVYRQGADKNSISSNEVSCIYKDRDNILWIGTENGLNRFDPVKEQFTRYYVEAGIKEYRGNNINAINGDDKHIWFSSFLKGLYKLDKRTGVIKNYKNDKSDPQSLVNDQVLKIFKDSSGTIWVGTWANGISYFHPDNQFKNYSHKKDNKNSLSSKEVFAICEDSKGVLWAASFNGGINRISPDGSKITHFLNDPLDKNSPSSNRVLTLAHDKVNTLWIGNRETGLSSFRTDTNVFTHYSHDSKDKSSLSSNRVRAVLIDNEKNVWVGTSRGLNRFEKQTGKFKRYYPAPDNINNLRNHITDIIEEGENFLWIGTLGGLSKMDKRDHSIVHCSSVNTITICNDSSEYLWLGTRFNGLVHFNKVNGTIKTYSTKDGLPGNKITGIIKDRSGNLWLSTDSGLVKFDLKTKAFQIFKKDDGIQSNEFIENSYYRSSNSTFYFGGYNGLTAFKPDSIKTSDFTPPVRITSITIYPAKVEPKQDLSKIEELPLNYKDTTVFVSFSSLDFRNPAKNRYAYKIDPVNKEWIDLGNKHDVMITNLNPGNYTLRVKGSNSDGIWNKKEISLNIYVSPPFWKTVWFRGIVLLALISLALIWHKKRLKSQEEKLRSEANMEQFCIKHKITERELEIIKLVIVGKTNREMEDILFISSGTVKNHIYNIFKKLNVSNRTQLTAMLSDWKKAIE